MAGKTRRRALRARGKKARPSLSRPGIGAAYCVESRRPACVKRRTRVAAYAYHLMRLVASGSSASVASWPLAPVSPRCHKAADAPAAGIPSVTFRHRSQTGASGQQRTFNNSAANPERNRGPANLTLSLPETAAIRPRCLLTCAFRDPRTGGRSRRQGP